MSVERVPFTPEGHAKLVAFLKDLKEVQRPANVLAIEEARAHGDLRENAEYHAAKEKQGWIAAQIGLCEDRLSRALVIDPKTVTITKVAFGATVTVRDDETDEEQTYKIVGSNEADAKLGLISYDAPLARSLLGKEEGDEVVFTTPKGKRKLEIVALEYK